MKNKITKQSKKIILQKHNPDWLKYFEQEKEIISSAFKNSQNLVKVLHIGSTSIAGLIAKPIIDIILVVKDLYQIETYLEIAGYKYKGEYNIPMREMYGKNTSYKIYLHAYEEDNPDIELNLLFKKYLIENPELIEEYSKLKQKILIEESISNNIVDNGITKYNLKKNDFIYNVLKKSGFKGFSIRLCTQDIEWQSYEILRNRHPAITELDKIYKINKEDINQKNLVLYNGTKIVAAAQLIIKKTVALLTFLNVHEDDIKMNNDIFYYFLEKIEKWIKTKFNVNNINCLCTNNQIHLYISNNYKHISSDNNTHYLSKILDK